MTPTNIIDAVRQYSRDKSILDEAVDIPFDKNLLEFQTLKDIISKINAIDDKKGLEINPYEGDTDLNIPNAPPEQQDDKSISGDYCNTFTLKKLIFSAVFCHLSIFFF